MARIRTVKPEFWTDGKMVQLPIVARLFYVGLWNFADDYGHVWEEADRLKMQIFPGDVVDADALVDLLVAAERLERFETEDGARFLRIVNFDKHQRVSHKAAPAVPIGVQARKLAIPQATRRAVATKYGCAPGEEKAAACYYCGLAGRIVWWRKGDGAPGAWVSFSGLELDHFAPESGGNGAHPENMVLACRACNRSKHTADGVAFLAGKVAETPEDSGVLRSNPSGKGKERKGTGTGEDQEQERVSADADGAPAPPVPIVVLETPTPAAVTTLALRPPPTPPAPPPPAASNGHGTGQAVVVHGAGRPPAAVVGVTGHLARNLDLVGAHARRESAAKRARRDAAAFVFAYWQRVFRHEGAILDADRERVLVKRLAENGDNVHELLYALDGAHSDPWTMGTDRRSVKKFDKITTILASREKVEEFAGKESGFRRGEPHPVTLQHDDVPHDHDTTPDDAAVGEPWEVSA